MRRRVEFRSDADGATWDAVESWQNAEGDIVIEQGGSVLLITPAQAAELSENLRRIASVNGVEVSK